MPLSLPFVTVKTFTEVTANFEKLATSVVPNALAGSVSNAQLQDDAVDARVLQDDAAVNANRAVTRDHIRDGAINGDKIDPTVPLPKRFAETIGDGVVTTITVDHNLGTRDLGVVVYETATGKGVPIDSPALVTPSPLLSIAFPTLNRIALEFTTAPAVDEYCVAVIG